MLHALFTIDLSTLDRWIIYISLAVPLAIGLWGARKNKNLQDHALGGGKLSSLSLWMLMVASLKGVASTTGCASSIFSDGIIMVVAYFFVIVQALFGAFWIAPRVHSFGKCLTAGDILMRCYGNRARLITASTGFLGALTATSVKFHALGNLAADLLQWDRLQSILFLGGIMVIYASLGGMRSIMASAAFRCIIILLLLPILVYTISLHGGGIFHTLGSIPTAKLALLQHAKLPYYIVLLLVWEVFPHSVLSMSMIQRMLATQSTQHVRKAWLGMAFLQIPFVTMVSLIGLFAVVHFPDIAPRQIFPKIIDSYLGVGMKGVAAAGLMTMVTAAIDSSLHTAGILLSHDLIKPLYAHQGKEINEFAWARISTWILGVLAIVLSLYVQDIVRTIVSTIGLIRPITAVPLMGAFLCSRVYVISYRNCIITTLLSFFGAYFLVPKNLGYVIPLITLVAGMLGYWVTHFAVSLKSQEAIAS